MRWKWTEGNSGEELNNREMENEERKCARQSGKEEQEAAGKREIKIGEV